MTFFENANELKKKREQLVADRESKDRQEAQAAAKRLQIAKAMACEFYAKMRQLGEPIVRAKRQGFLAGSVSGVIFTVYDDNGGFHEYIVQNDGEVFDVYKQDGRYRLVDAPGRRLEYFSLTERHLKEFEGLLAAKLTSPR